MPARKPGGKYKGVVSREKGAATIAAELEHKRRLAYQETLKKLAVRRAEEAARPGLQSDEDEAQMIKLQKIAMMFGTGKKATYKKFFQNWKVGIIQIKKDKLLAERQLSWRRSCQYCTKDGKPGHFGARHDAECQCWWKSSLGRDHWGEELNPAAAAADRPVATNLNRMCTCCGVDTGAPAHGCRAFHMLTDTGFERPSDAEDILRKRDLLRQHVKFSSMGSASSPDLLSASSPRSPMNKMTLSAQTNMANLRRRQAVPEYDPTAPFALSDEQAYTEERRSWITSLEDTAGAPTWMRAGRSEASLTLPPISPGSSIYRPLPVPSQTEKGKPLEKVLHWRTGMKTMLDTHMMKMYVVGVQ